MTAMLRLPDLYRRLFRRAIKEAVTAPASRARLSLTALEDRTTPTPMITVAKIADAIEAGTDGVFRFTRTGDTTDPLTINVTIGGTATPEDDYTDLGQQVTLTIDAGSATADLVVDAMSDAIYDPDETVIATIANGPDYTVGTPNSATVNITNDSSTVQTLIHQQTFTLTGATGTANVTLTVTYNAPGHAGKYLWSYSVQNPSSSTSSWTTFSVPVSNMDTDVGNLTSSIGWTGTVGASSVSWAAGTALAPGQSATFSFTTDPREIGPATIAVTGAGGTVSADLPTAPAPRQVAEVPTVSLSVRGAAQSYKMKLDMTVANGSAYTTGTITINASTATTARDFIYGFLKDNGWAVEKAGDTGLRILGNAQSDGTIVAVKTLKYKFTDVLSPEPPALQGIGQVEVRAPNKTWPLGG
jgi:hypothetical protein